MERQVEVMGYREHVCVSRRLKSQCVRELCLGGKARERGRKRERGGVVEDVLPLQHFVTFSFLSTLPELPLPFPLQLALSGQCDQSVPPCALCKHVLVYS